MTPWRSLGPRTWEVGVREEVRGPEPNPTMTNIELVRPLSDLDPYPVSEVSSD